MHLKEFCKHIAGLVVARARSIYTCCQLPRPPNRLVPRSRSPPPPRRSPEETQRRLYPPRVRETGARQLPPCRSPPPSPRASAPAPRARPRPRGGAPTPVPLCLSPRAAAAAPRPRARPYAWIPRRRGSSAPRRRWSRPDRVAVPNPPRPALLLLHPQDGAVEAR